MSPFRFLVLVLATLLSSFCCEGVGQAPRPNIVVIVADDLGYGDLGCYGQAEIRTPALDRLAKEGVRFTQAYAGSSICSPSRASLLTGHRPGNLAIEGNNSKQGLPADSGTLGTLFKAAGYSTGLFGKWDSGRVGTSGEPLRQGFDEFFGYDSDIMAHNYWPAWLWHNRERVPLANEVKAVKPWYSNEMGGVATKREEYAPDRILAALIGFVKDAGDAPYFALWTPTLPHANNEAGDNGMEVPDFGKYKDKDWPDPIKGYAAAVTRLDSDVGRLIQALDTSGSARPTIVFFTSDNGPHSEGGYDPTVLHSSGNLRGKKRDLYEGGIRIPLIVWGGGVQQQATEETPVAFWDFWATCADLSGASVSSRDGRSFADSLMKEAANRSKSLDRPLYWELSEGAPIRAVRFGRWKVVDFPEQQRAELYDLQADESETTDLSAKYPEILKEGLGLIQKLQEKSE